MRCVSSMKLKSFATMVLLFTLLSFPTVASTSSESSNSTVTLRYDRGDHDSAYEIFDPLAVRFSPPKIYLGQGYTCTLFEITAIELFVISDDPDSRFSIYVTDENHNVLKSYLNQVPPIKGWFNVDLTDWDDDSRYITTHFFVQFVANAPSPNSPSSCVMLCFDEDETPSLRSYMYTTVTENTNDENANDGGITDELAWIPIELTDTYGSGDLMIRVGLKPQTPDTFLPSLKDAISAADEVVFKGKATSHKATLIKKINAATLFFERGSYIAGFNKLENDIAPKLADPRPTPVGSWLETYAVGSYNQKLVTSFAAICQEIIRMAQKSASLPGEPEICDFNNDNYDDLAIGIPYENIDGKENAGAVNVLYGSPNGITEESDQYWRQGKNGLKGESHTDDMFGVALAIGDFNGDSCDDLAAGSPGDDACDPDNNIIKDVGSVSVLYGSESGLTEKGDQQWAQMYITSNPYSSELNDRFGSALAAGDFNGDGYDDLAIGVPGEDSGANDCGEVDILYGSSMGITSSGNQVWSQDLLEGAEEYQDWFGLTLTVGDFNADGFEDLAIGVPNENIGGIEDAGAVNVIYGSVTGLTSMGNQVWYQDSDPLISDTCETEDFFGAALAAGDFNGDGYDDLAIGVPGESIWAENARALNIFYGSSAGLSAEQFEIIEPEYFQVDSFYRYDDFGASLATGDFDHDGYEDLAVGVPKADIIIGQSVSEDAGGLLVRYGCSQGLYESTRSDNWVGDDFSYPYTHIHGGNWFAAALTMGDFNGDGYCDLAIGSPKADPILHKDNEEGAVTVMTGSVTGLLPQNFSVWYQDKEGVDGDGEDYDYFGSSLPGSYWPGIWY